MENTILNTIKRVEIDCPDCEYMTDDEQYTCTTCWCEGGNGKINVLQYIKEHQKMFEQYYGHTTNRNT